MLVVSDSNMAVATTARAVRVFRLGRLMRLLRMAKMQDILEHLGEQTPMVWSMSVLRIMKLIMLLVCLNHIIACIWCQVGSNGLKAGTVSWISLPGSGFVSADVDVVYRYFTALH